MWLPLTYPWVEDLACNPGMCPDWESNQQPSGSQTGTQSEPYLPVYKTPVCVWCVCVCVCVCERERETERGRERERNGQKALDW